MAIATIEIPARMSYVNAFWALYTEGGVRKMYSWTPEKVDNLFRERIAIGDHQSISFDYVDGQRIKTSFEEFPTLKTWGYGGGYGDINDAKEAAERALNEYDKVPSPLRLDANDSYSFDKLKSKMWWDGLFFKLFGI